MNPDPVQPGETIPSRWFALRRGNPLNFWSVPEGRWPVVTLLILALSVGVTALASFAEELLPTWLYASGYDVWIGGRYTGVLTSIFLHVGILHLVFNCYWFWYFGRVLEPRLGSRRYLIFMLAAAWATGLGELAVSGNPGVGLSGVLYSQFGYMLANRRQDPLFELLLPRSTVFVLLIWLFLCIALTYTDAMAIANGAHFAGFAIGCATGFLSRGNFRRAAPASLAMALVFSWPLAWAPWHEAFLVGTAARLIEAKKFPKAALVLEAAVEKQPKNEWAWLMLTQIQAKNGQYAAAKTSFISGLKYSEGPTLPNNFAWLLSTCPVDTIRDGELALRYATKACELTNWKNAGYIDTYAAALAETGEFAKAVEWMDKALALNPAQKAVLEQHRVAFVAGKAWREAQTDALEAK